MPRIIYTTLPDRIHPNSEMAHSLAAGDGLYSVHRLTVPRSHPHFHETRKVEFEEGAIVPEGGWDAFSTLVALASSASSAGSADIGDAIADSLGAPKLDASRVTGEPTSQSDLGDQIADSLGAPMIR